MTYVAMAMKRVLSALFKSEPSIWGNPEHCSKIQRYISLSHFPSRLKLLICQLSSNIRIGSDSYFHYGRFLLFIFNLCTAIHSFEDGTGIQLRFLYHLLTTISSRWAIWSRTDTTDVLATVDWATVDGSGHRLPPPPPPWYRCHMMPLATQHWDWFTLKTLLSPVFQVPLLTDESGHMTRKSFFILWPQRWILHK